MEMKWNLNCFVPCPHDWISSLPPHFSLPDHNRNLLREREKGKAFKSREWNCKTKRRRRNEIHVKSYSKTNYWGREEGEHSHLNESQHTFLSKRLSSLIKKHLLPRRILAFFRSTFAFSENSLEFEFEASAHAPKTPAQFSLDSS